jgi:RHS repeat-associated protein
MYPIFSGRDNIIRKNLLILCLMMLFLPLDCAADSPVSGGPGHWENGVWVGDPIYVNSGAYSYSLPLLHSGGPLPLDAILHYRTDGSWMALGIPMDPNSPAHFQHSLFPNVEAWAPDSNNVTKVYFETMRAGELLLFNGQQTAGSWSWVQQGNSRVHYTLIRTAAGYYWLMDPISEKVYLFQPYGTSNGYRIMAYLDRNGNSWTYSYANTNTVLPQSVSDGLGRSLQFTFASTPAFEMRRALTSITDQAGRNVSFDAVALAYYTAVTDAAGKKTLFGFDSSKYLSQVTRPLGNIPTRQTYALAAFNGKPEVRTVSQTDALGNATTLGYDSVSNKLTITYPDNKSDVFSSFDNNGAIQSITDAAGNKSTFTQTPQGQTSGATDRLGGVTSYTYHPESGKIQSVTNPKGKTITFTYSSQTQNFSNPAVPGETVSFTFYNLTKIDYPDKTNEQFTYDIKGNCVQWQDRAGALTAFTYNSQGQLLTVLNPAGGSATYAYNLDGTLASSKNSDTGITTYSYDVYKRPVQSTLPDGSTVQYTYDLNNRITSVTDGRGNNTNYSYDDNGNLLRITNAADKSVQYAYDQMDRLVSITNTLGKVTAYAYDVRGRISKLTDPSGIATTFSYDARGWINQVTQANQNHKWTYNNEGAATAFVTPLGSNLQKTLDPTGYISGITTPNGGNFSLAYDDMQRLKSLTDPLTRLTQYGYDARGLLTSVVLPDGSKAQYERNASGWLTKITDLNAKVWSLSRSSMGRLLATTDPLNRVKQYTYDNRGRLSQIAFPDGGTVTFSRDPLGNPARMLYSNGPDLSFTYDVLSRLIKAGNLEFSYNDAGRITNNTDGAVSWGTTRDDAGRVISATYANGAFAVNYSYDPVTGLLASVKDTLTQSQVQFTYDADRHLTGMARSNGINSTLTWDSLSRLTGIRDGSTGKAPLLESQATLDAAGQVTQSRLNLPLDPGTLLSNETTQFTYDGAGQISSPGYTYDARGRLLTDKSRTYTWDGASRLIGVGDATLSYSNLGTLQSRTTAGKTIRYHTHFGLSARPIVAEQDGGSQQFLKYYIWTPDGKLLYTIDTSNGNAVYFYHFDRAGSIVALTNSGGNLTDSYAYTPNGRLLSHQGNIDQPFTFMGYFGVRQEGSGGTLYQMRARYYDAVSGRFLSPEPRWPFLLDPRQLNPYSYALNNPLNYGDISGLDTGWTDVFHMHTTSVFDLTIQTVLGPISGNGDWTPVIYDSQAGSSFYQDPAYPIPPAHPSPQAPFVIQQFSATTWTFFKAAAQTFPQHDGSSCRGSSGCSSDAIPTGNGNSTTIPGALAGAVAGSTNVTSTADGTTLVSNPLVQVQGMASPNGSALLAPTAGGIATPNGAAIVTEAGGGIAAPGGAAVVTPQGSGVITSNGAASITSGGITVYNPNSLPITIYGPNGATIVMPNGDVFTNVQSTDQLPLFPYG